MTSDTICVSKDEFDLLIRCRQIVRSEFEERYSKDFIASVRESEEAYKKGDFIRVKNSRERRKLFDSL